MTIQKVAVIGAGVMGAGIAAQLANAGYEVELLDIVPKDNPNRNVIAESAIEKMLKTNPAPLMHKKNAKRIRPGNIEDNIDRLKDCDLIIEAVLENPQIKSSIFKKIDENRKAGSTVASNTSTIPLKDLIADQSEQFKKDFVITHFFNPPRYMPLLELITSEHNSAEKVAEITRFMDEKAGKGVVICHDTPGFIANRIGTFWIQAAINDAIDKGLTIEEADAIVGRPMGVPKSGVFGLVDLVGLDLMPHISKSLSAKLPADDGYVQGIRSHAVIEQMIKDGFIGRKGGKGGFYRRDENKKEFSVDLKTGTTYPKKKAKPAAAENGKKGLKAVFETKDKYGEYAWSVFKQTVAYAAEHAHDIAADITAVDTAMKLGYNWKKGPFEMLDDVGIDYVLERMKRDGDKIPAFLQQAAGQKFYKTENGKLQFRTQDGGYKNVERPEGVLLLSDVKRASKPIAASGSIPGVGKVGAALWDIGDGVICLEFTSKMNSLDFATMNMIDKACDLIEAGKYKALVIHNEGDNFSAGANLGLALYAAKLKQTWLIDKMVKRGQETVKRMKYSKFPIVSAPSGLALGGGCEILLHSHHVQAHAETYVGLVEVGVGLLPAWGGSTEMLTRAKNNKKVPNGPMPAVATIFETISTAKVATSAQEARDLMYLRDTDGITMNKSRLLADAKKKALELANDPNFKPEEPQDIVLPGPSGLAALSMAVDGFYQKGAITPYDVVVSDKVAKVLTGGPDAGPGMLVSQDQLRALEHKHFMELVHDKRTLARLETMLKTGKPLREKPIKGKTARSLRDEADKPGMLSRFFCGKKAKKDFHDASRKSCNDNAKPKRDTKAQVNWPNLKKKKK
jgi:3-hydroxyacyl-CoA dehydrogenase